MRCCYNENKGDDGSVWCATRASRPLIQHEVLDKDAIGHCHYKNKGNDGLIRRATIASQSLI
eukprot:11341089-Ditylum_brightwellii.AAC.1